MGDQPIMLNKAALALAHRLLDCIPRDEWSSVANQFVDQPSAASSDESDIESVIVNLAGDIVRGRDRSLDESVKRIREVISDPALFDEEYKKVLQQMDRERLKLSPSSPT